MLVSIDCANSAVEIGADLACCILAQKAKDNVTAATPILTKSVVILMV